MNSNILHETVNQNKDKESTFHSQGVQNENSSEEFMAEGIFMYGTLMAEEFLSWVLTGFFDNAATIVSLRQLAILSGYRRVAVNNGDYPAIISGDEFDKVGGFLVVSTNKSQWKKLDDFEDENYRRPCVHVDLPQAGRIVPAYVYLWQDSIEKLSIYLYFILDLTSS